MIKKIRLTESDLHNIIKESVKKIIKEGGIHNKTPKAIIDDIEENLENSSITQMDSSWYVVGIHGKYGDYEIDVPANGHCRIKRYRYNSHNKPEDDQYYYYSTDWFEYCENNNSPKITESRMLTEGEEWIGTFNQHNFEDLRNKVNGCKGNCSFSLNGKDFTIIPTQRGFTITSGVDFGYDALNVDNALKAAWRFSNY